MVTVCSPCAQSTLYTKFLPHKTCVRCLQDAVRSGGAIPSHNIIVCANGTWCGAITGTTTNVQILANSFAGCAVASGVPAHNNNTTVCYFDGVGLTGTFSEYLVDGALALDIKNRCVDAYMSIVQHYRPLAGSKIWLFGHSRGAYTIRCVAGMINNCGILCLNNLGDAGLLRLLCSEVYTIYRSREAEYRPDSDFSRRFKREKSHSTREPPIRFMGLLDTVGKLLFILYLVCRAQWFQDTCKVPCTSAMQSAYGLLYSLLV